MSGFGGAGAFSDGKYVISTEYGGWLPDFLPAKTVLDYIEQCIHMDEAAAEDAAEVAADVAAEAAPKDAVNDAAGDAAKDAAEAENATEAE